MTFLRQTKRHPSRQERFAGNPWLKREFLVFGAGNLLNNVGDAIYAVALPLLVFEITHSLAAMSLMASIGLLPMALGPFLGHFADRHGGQRLIVPSLLIQIASGLIMNIFAIHAGDPLWLLFVTATVLSLGGGIYRFGWMTSLRSLFGEDAPRVRGRLGSLYVVSTIIGPMVAALILQFGSLEALMWCNLGTFVVPVLCERALDRSIQIADMSSPSMGIFSSIAEGWRLLRKAEGILALVVVQMPIILFSTGLISGLGIYFMRSVTGLSSFGVSVALVLVNLGTLAGSLFVSERTNWKVERVMLFALIGIPISLVAMAVQSKYLFIICLTVYAACDGAAIIVWQVVVYRMLPENALGRVNGILRLINGIPAAASPFVIEAVVSAVGPRYAFAVVGGVSLISLAGLVLQWKKIKLLSSDSPRVL